MFIKIQMDFISKLIYERIQLVEKDLLKRKEVLRQRQRHIMRIWFLC